MVVLRLWDCNVELAERVMADSLWISRKLDAKYQQTERRQRRLVNLWSARACNVTLCLLSHSSNVQLNADCEHPMN